MIIDNSDKFDYISEVFSLNLLQTLEVVSSGSKYRKVSGEIISQLSIKQVAISYEDRSEVIAETQINNIEGDVITTRWQALISTEEFESNDLILFIQFSNDREELISINLHSFSNIRIEKKISFSSNCEKNYTQNQNHKNPQTFPEYLKFAESISENTNLEGLKICIAATDLVGPIKNGGIGTFNYSLAELLAEHGAKVEILWLQGTFLEVESIEFWKDYFKCKNINFIPLEISKSTTYASHWRQVSLSAFEQLSQSSYDFVYFGEMCGSAYDTLLAKKYSEKFQNTQIYVIAHSSTRWHKFFNQELIDTDAKFEIDFLERKTVEMADLVISPSQYLLNWCLSENWNLPEKTVVLPYPIMSYLADKKIELQQKYREICFFGRLESRKGLEVFCDALDLIASELGEIKIVFLGKITTVNRQRSDEYLSMRANNWSFQYQIIKDFSHQDVINYLSEGDKLAVVASISDNSPFTVYECLNLGIPLIAAKSGGIPELFSTTDNLFEANSKSLAALLSEKIKEVPHSTPPKVDYKRIHKAWINIHGDKNLVSPLKKTYNSLGTGVRTCVILITKDHISGLNEDVIDNDSNLHIFWNMKDRCFIYPEKDHDHQNKSLSYLNTYLENHNINNILFKFEGIELFKDAIKKLHYASCKAPSKIAVGSTSISTSFDGDDEIDFKIPVSNAIPADELGYYYGNSYILSGDIKTILLLLENNVFVYSNPITCILQELTERKMDWAAVPECQATFKGNNFLLPDLYANFERDRGYSSWSDSLKTIANEIIESDDRPIHIENPQLKIEKLNDVKKFFDSRRIIKSFSNKKSFSPIVLGSGKILTSDKGLFGIHFDNDYVSTMIDASTGLYPNFISVFIEVRLTRPAYISIGFGKNVSEYFHFKEQYIYSGNNLVFFNLEVEHGSPLILKLKSQKDDIAEIIRLQIREAEKSETIVRNTSNTSFLTHHAILEIF